MTATYVSYVPTHSMELDVIEMIRLLSNPGTLNLSKTSFLLVSTS